MWRPKEGWMKDPCIDCADMQVDNWGYLCDLACGKHTAYFNREAGADAVLKSLKDYFPTEEELTTKITQTLYGGADVPELLAWLKERYSNTFIEG